MAKKAKLEIETEWTLFECDKSRRWSEVSRASYHDGDNPYISKAGDFCQFSGCLEKDHKIRVIQEHSKAEDVHLWFRGWEPWESSPVSRSLQD